MPLLLRKTIVLAEVETTDGDDAAPVVGSNAVLVDSVSVTPHIEHIERPGLHGTVGQLASVPGRSWYDIELTFEIKGAGDTAAQADVPNWAALVRSACFAETTGGGARIYTTAAPRSASDVSCTIWVYRDGIVFKATGCRGNLKLDGAAGQRIMATWSGKGLMADLVGAPAVQTFVPPADLAFPASATYDAEQPYPALGLGILFGAAGYQAVMESFSLDAGNEISDRPDFNAVTGFRGFQITNRNPSLTLNPEATTEALATAFVSDAGNITGFWQLLNTRNALMALTATAGSGAGEVVSVSLPKVQVRDIKLGERNGLQTYELDCGVRENAGNDEIVISIT